MNVIPKKMLSETKCMIKLSAYCDFLRTQHSKKNNKHLKSLAVEFCKLKKITNQS